MSDNVDSERRPDGADAASAPAAPSGGPARYDPGWSSSTWMGAEPPARPPIGPLQAIRGALRLVVFVLTTLLLLPVFFIARALGGRRDRAVAGLWCAAGARICGLRVRRLGRPIDGGGAILCNHASWIDILTIGGLAPVHFVAKAEVSGWPMFGWIARIADTVFVARRRTEAKAQEEMLVRRAQRGDVLCLFPEGTSSDGQRVLPFKSSLFALFFAGDPEEPPLRAQPVSVFYAPHRSLDPSFYGWWGKMTLFDHIWAVVCLSRGGEATITFHTPLDRLQVENRKAMAAAAEAAVASGVEAGRRAARPS